jgi:hypothetical protein
MSGFKYSVQVLDLKEVHELPEGWTPDNFRGLLTHVEYDDVGGIPLDELKDMAQLALSDFEVEEAAVKVLEFRMGDQLSKGQRQNLAEELKEDRIWEEYSDISIHEELFNIVYLLYESFPKEFSTPDIAKLKIKVASVNQESQSNLVNPSASFLARVLNDGMDGRNIMYRLFGDRIEANSFPEAEHILWKYEAAGFSAADNSNTFTIYTSWNWIAGLKGVTHFESTAFSDGQL